MGRHWRIAMIGTVLWSASIAFMIAGTLRQSIIVMAWGGFLALVACIVSGWLIATCAATTAAHAERLDMEHLAEIMAHCAANEAATTRLR